MLVNMLMRYRVSRAVAALPARLQRDVGVELESARRYLPELPAGGGAEARLRRLVGVCLLRG